MTVDELLKEIEKNCPPVCHLGIRTVDKMTGETGTVDGVKFVYDGRNMVVALIVEDDAEK